MTDHIYDVKDESELFPDRNEFGFAYLSINEIPENYIKSQIMDKLNISDEKVFDKKFKKFNYKDYLVFNNVMVDVKDKTKINEVKNAIEDKVKNAKAIINIEDTASYMKYQSEIDEGKTYVGVFSGLFLFIAMLSVITAMTRIINNQKIQIGTLKALGFSNSKIIFHYIGYGFYLALLGAIAGLLLGYYFIGNVFIGLEMVFFEIPNGHPVMTKEIIIVAILVILAVTFITYLTGRKILKENPAEALRTTLPNVKSRTLNITKKGFFKKLNFSTKWNIRDMIRNKMRTLMGIAGIMGCTMLIVCALGMLDSMNYFVHLQFNELYNFDYKLNLKSGISNDELLKLENTYGNYTSKSYGIEIKTNDGRESNNIFVTDAGNLVRFVNRKGKYVKFNSDEGIYVTYKLAQLNNYKLGDEITWHIYGDDHYYTSKIVGFNKDPQNQNITMTRKYLESLGIKYEPDTIYTNYDLSKTNEIKNVSSIQDIESLKESMNNLLSMMKTMLTLIIFIAILLGSVIIYNLGILSYSEKQ